eukprot:2211356-Prymnesium_polylepis.2
MAKQLGHRRARVAPDPPPPGATIGQDRGQKINMRASASAAPGSLGVTIRLFRAVAHFLPPGSEATRA